MKIFSTMFAKFASILALAFAAAMPAHATTDTTATVANLAVTTSGTPSVSIILTGHGYGTGSICGTGGTYYARIDSTGGNFTSVISVLQLAAATGLSVTIGADLSSGVCYVTYLQINF